MKRGRPRSCSLPLAHTFNSSGQIQLANGNVFSVVVTGPGPVVLTQGVDYALDPVNGIITVLAGGAASAGETVQIAYSYSDEVVASAGQSAPTD